MWNSRFSAGMRHRRPLEEGNGLPVSAARYRGSAREPLGRGEFQRELAAETSFALRRHLAPRGPAGCARSQPSSKRRPVRATPRRPARCGRRSDQSLQALPARGGFAIPRSLSQVGAGVGQQEDLALTLDQATREHRLGDADPEAAGEVAVTSASGAEGAGAPGLLERAHREARRERGQRLDRGRDLGPGEAEVAIASALLDGEKPSALRAWRGARRSSSARRRRLRPARSAAAPGRRSARPAPRRGWDRPSAPRRRRCRRRRLPRRRRLDVDFGRRMAVLDRGCHIHRLGR